VITIKFAAYTDAEIDEYRVYRSITGFTIPFPNTITSEDQLIISATDPEKQFINFSDTSIAGMQLAINKKLRGLVATPKSDSSALIVRAAATIKPKIKLFSSTFLDNANQEARIIAPRSEYTQVATIPFDGSIEIYAWEDADGDNRDWYYITTVKDGIESLPTYQLQPAIYKPDLCVISGRLTDLQSNPLPGVELRLGLIAKHQPDPITTKDVVITTDELGRFVVAVQQGRLVLFLIEQIGYNEIIRIPAQPFVSFADLVPVNDHFYEQDNG